MPSTHLNSAAIFGPTCANKIGKPYRYARLNLDSSFAQSIPRADSSCLSSFLSRSSS